jgi:hypothetical protein
VHVSGHFRFVNFGHPPPVVFSADSHKFAQIDNSRMVQFPPLGLQIPEDEGRLEIWHYSFGDDVPISPGERTVPSINFEFLVPLRRA